MILKKTYAITNWPKWAEEVDHAAKDFFARTNHWPNFLLVNEPTFARLQFIATQDVIDISINIDEALAATAAIAPTPISAASIAPESIHESIEGLFPLIVCLSENYRIEFCMDNSIPSEKFSLIHRPALAID